MACTYDKLIDEVLMHSHTISDITDLDAPIQARGNISANSDFPTLAEIQTGWAYYVLVDVTDDDATKTNTGDSFEAGDEIVWTSSNTWAVWGSSIWKRDGTVINTRNPGDDLIITGVITAGLLTFSGDTISSNSGNVDFTTDNLINIGNITTTGLGTFGNLDVDTLNLNGNEITDSTGTISFVNENLTTTGLGTFGDVTINDGTDPTLIIEEVLGNPFKIIDEGASQTTLSKSTASGNANIAFDPKPEDNSGTAQFRFFRTTDTSGAVTFNVFKGDGTSTVNHVIAGNEDTRLALNNGNILIKRDDARLGFGALGVVDGYITFGGTNMEYFSAGVHDFLANNITTTGIITGEQLTSTDDITMNGHLFTLGDSSVNDPIIRFTGSSNSGDLRWDESIPQWNFNNQIKISDTVDTWGRLIIAQKFNYDLSAGNSKYILDMSPRSTTAGSKSMYGMLLDVRPSANSGTQIGQIISGFNQVYISGTADITGAVKGSYNIIRLASTSTVSNTYASQSKGKIENGITGTINNYFGFSDLGIDAEDGTVTNAYNFYGSAHAVDTGTLTNAYGLYLKEQTAASNNYQIYSEGGNTFMGAGDHESQEDFFFSGTGSGLPFAEIYAYNANTTITISGTGIANKVQITTFDTNGLSNNATPDHTNDHITITKAGVYKINVSIHAESTGGTGYEAGFALYKNNGATLFPNVHGHRELSGGGGDTGSISLTGLVDLAVNDTIELWVWNETNTNNIIIDDITLNLIQIGG